MAMGYNTVSRHTRPARARLARAGGVQPLEHLLVKQVGEGLEPEPDNYTRPLFSSRS